MSANDVRNLHENYQGLKDGPLSVGAKVQEVF